MSEGESQPYNSLGQIIAAGGEIALGLAIVHGWTDRQIALLFSRRFEPMRAEDRQRLTDIANAAIGAADRINAIPVGGDISLSDVPIIPGLFGDEPEGRRVKIIGEWQFEEGGQWYETRLDLADLPSLLELARLIAQHGREVGQACRDKFGFDKEEPIPVSGVRITFAGRGF